MAARQGESQVRFAKEVPAMGRTLDQMLNSLPAAQRAVVATRASEFIAEEWELIVSQAVQYGR